MTTSCPPDLSTTPTPDMTTVADLGGPSSDGGCMPLPPVGCDLDAADDPLGKITICHIPPGNPANRHTIVVGAPAASAHLAHGDYLGACKAVCQ
jgi:hypothetical protein